MLLFLAGLRLISTVWITSATDTFDPVIFSTSHSSSSSLQFFYKKSTWNYINHSNIAAPEAYSRSNFARSVLFHHYIANKLFSCSKHLNFNFWRLTCKIRVIFVLLKRNYFFLLILFKQDDLLDWRRTRTQTWLVETLLKPEVASVSVWTCREFGTCCQPSCGKSQPRTDFFFFLLGSRKHTSNVWQKLTECHLQYCGFICAYLLRLWYKHYWRTNSSCWTAYNISVFVHAFDVWIIGQWWVITRIWIFIM